MKQNKIENKEDYEIKFWKDWLKADSLKKSKMVENLSIIKMIDNIEKLPKKLRKHSLALILNSFFEDLENACYVKYREKTK